MGHVLYHVLSLLPCQGHQFHSLYVKACTYIGKYVCLGVSEEDDNEDDDDAEDNEDSEEDDDDEDDEDAEQGEEAENAEDSSSGDENSDRCPICLNRLRVQDIGTPESCDHSFCLECIQEWAKVCILFVLFSFAFLCLSTFTLRLAVSRLPPSLSVSMSVCLSLTVMCKCMICTSAMCMCACMMYTCVMCLLCTCVVCMMCTYMMCKCVMCT